MAGIKFAFFFAALLLAIVVNPFMIGSPKMKVTALRNLPLDMDMEMVERNLLIDGWLTCKRACNQNSDCSDGWFCKTCAIPALGEKYMQCLHHLDSSKYAQVIPTTFMGGGENLLQ
ncbi:PREDICTED: uncharacterized protein LOC109210095 [Nicotiana attenuata]|uniref:Carboxypeptidase A inhibitor-like domain-containing protein n=1 Tax=Nicotiana attenuata TaxID=49451 RepID=A0A314KMG0_NICAT|nr:PREDICTED: uncharacterized protein LOC109210095 [Nicotiana attenuata]OIT30367.1 hypothetical protein A4A49_15769 [Nicotiana attenuata]